MDVQEIVKDIKANIPIFIDDKEKMDKDSSYLEEYSSTADETCLVSLNSQSSVDDGCINFTPGERKKSKSILNDQFCEELGFSCLFPTGKFGYRVQRDVKLSPYTFQSKLSGLQTKV